MRRKHWEGRVFLFGCLLAALNGCTADDPQTSPEKLSSTYLPLEVGNYWDFRSVHSPTNTVVQHREVSGISQLNGHEYYLVTTRTPQEDTIIDSVYYRIESNGDVFSYRPSMGIEELKYKLFADDGDSWSYPLPDNDVMDVTLHLGTITTQSKTVDGCKSYSFDVPRWADEEHTITLAPGVGFIREYSDAWGSGKILRKASIGGNVTDY